ncbi:MAG: hypothetical protein ACRDD2_11140 [Sarcina sp.]
MLELFIIEMIVVGAVILNIAVYKIISLNHLKKISELKEKLDPIEIKMKNILNLSDEIAEKVAPNTEVTKVLEIVDVIAKIISEKNIASLNEEDIEAVVNALGINISEDLIKNIKEKIENKI